jgi:hypothetical protein
MPSLPPPIPNQSGPVLPPQSGGPPAVKTPQSLGGFRGLEGGPTILLVVLAIVFHAGAGYLSYQKHGSAGWAFLAFLFALLYYPYYAFTSPAPAQTMMMGGLRKLIGLRR